MNQDQYIQKAQEIAAKYPKTKACVKYCNFGGGYSIEVETVDQAKALNEMFRGFKFTSGPYR